MELLRPLSRAKKELLESQESLDESLSAAVREIQPDLVAAQEAIGASDNTEENQTVVKDSNVYIPLNTDIDRMAKEQHSLEIKKALNYPRFYKYHDQLKIQVTESEEKAILTFKQILVKTGQIGQYDPEAFSVPKKFDLLKNYFVSGSNDDLYYKSKMTPDLSSDKLVQDLIGKTKIDIVISTNCLIKLAEMQSDFTVGGCIPLIVEQDGSRKVLYFERPLPKERLSAMDKNKIVYDAAFKSICLDWANRHPVSSNPIKCEHNNDWNYHDDENLQYTHWVFGGLSLLIQYQFDSEITNTEKRANLISKLEYKTDDKQEVTTASERVTNWLRSYIGGHSIVIEGKVDVANNSLTSIKKKQMVDIMGDWVPNYESEMLRQTIFSLHRKLKAGNYLLDHKPNDKCFVIYASTDDGTFDLHKKYSEL
ncbi:hypothetical protein BY458DRAFT_521556 [Sporodiniella umbellata]|nr:hypothetical protein BY458DRAFT_521556 [Sporodiniella umbellata]